MEPRGQERIVTLRVELDETSEQTQAKVDLTLGDDHFGGWGRARRNPTDPDVPRVGEELAIARALSDLSHHLLDRAVREIEEFEGAEVHVHG